MSTHSERLRFAPKVPVGWIVQLYRRDALQLQDDELVDKVGGRLYARCLDILMVSDGRLACPECQTEFHVPWIGESPARVAQCPRCTWRITAGTFHSSFEHQDLLGINARPAFAGFVERGAALNGSPALRRVESMDLARRPLFFDPPWGPAVLEAYREGAMWDRRVPAPAKWPALAGWWAALNALPIQDLWIGRGQAR